MRPISSTAIAIVAIDLLSACDKTPQSSATSSLPDYEIVKNEIVKEENKHDYDSLGDTTFTRTQTYKVRRVAKGKEKESRILFLKYVRKVGNKDVSDGITTVVIDDGEGELLCANLYDVKTSNYDATPDPICIYTALGDTALAPVNIVFK